MATTDGMVHFKSPLGFDDVIQLSNVNTTATLGAHSTLAGQDLTVGNVSQTVILGSDSTVGVPAGGNRGVVLGHALDVSQFSLALIAGYDITSGLGLTSAVVLGQTIDIGASYTNGVLAGNNLSVGTGSPGCVLVGTALDVGDTSPNCVLAGLCGSGNMVGDGSSRVVAVGYYAAGCAGDGCLEVASVGSTNTFGDLVTYSTALGSEISVGNSCDHVHVHGDNVTVGAGTTDSVAHGNGIVIAAGIKDVVVLGHEAAASASDAIAVGHGANSQHARSVCLGVSTASAGINGIAIGPYANAGANQCEIGRSINLYPIDLAIHTFTVRGWDLGAMVAINTFVATDTPAAGCTGLTLVYNDGAAYANKVVKAAASIPVGALYLYVE